MNRLRAAWLRRGVSLDILDARKVADHLAENIFNDTWMQDLSQFLPVISKRRSEWALTNAIPPSLHYVSRPADESAVLKQLKERRYLSVSGINGIGKSAMCAALAKNSIGYDIVLWIDARQLTSTDDLHDYHVARSSSSINLSALVSE